MPRMRLLSSLVGFAWALVACTVKVVDVSDETGSSETGAANTGEVDEPCDPTDTGTGGAEGAAEGAAADGAPGAPEEEDDDEDDDDEFASPCARGFACRPVVDEPGKFVCRPEKEPPQP